MSYRIGKTLRFSAAHALDHLPAAHKCHQVHGHNYRVEVMLAADDLDDDGFVLDFGEVKATLGAWLDETWDHQNLNDVLGPGFRTTAENLAERIWLEARLRWPWGLRLLHGVTVWETDDSWAAFP